MQYTKFTQVMVLVVMLICSINLIEYIQDTIILDLQTVQYTTGNPYEMFWNDCDDTRGFHIWDSDTYEATPVNNPHRMFHKIY